MSTARRKAIFANFALSSYSPQKDFSICENCIDISIETLSQPGGFPLNFVRPQVYDPYQYSCRLCIALWDRGGDKSVVKRTLHFIPSDPSDPESQAGIEILGEGNKDESAFHRFVPIYTDEGDVARDSGVEVKREWWSTGSRRAMSTVKHWMEKCDGGHDCLVKGPWVGEEAEGWKPPARLVEVWSCDGEMRVKIVDVSEWRETPRYLTLSYCWGTGVDAGYVTTTKNVNERQDALSLEILPKTITDAIEVSHRLGINHIWIDALCILQDSPQDWTIEAAKMGSIYARSYLTISADSSSNASEGLFRQRQASNMHSYSRTNTLSTGHESTIYISLRNYDKEVSPRTDANTQPLSQRGWCLQERILSPRILHFTDQEIYWECRTTSRLEEESRGFCCDMKWKKEAERIGLVRKLRLDDTKERISATWYLDLITNEFSRRKLSVRTDVLPAVGGLARVVGGRLGSEYCAGLWREGIEWGLLWYRDESPRVSVVDNGESKGSGQVQKGEYLAPSWSWAAIGAAVKWRLSKSYPGANPRFLIDKIDIELLGEDPYGRVESGRLEITGHIRYGKMGIRNGKYQFKDGNEWFGDCFMDDVESPGLAVLLLMFEPMGQSKFYLLLRETGEDVSEYRRMGLLVHTASKHDLHVGTRQTITII